MRSRKEVRSFLLGIIAGFALLLVLGAVTRKDSQGPYQLGMAANDTYVFYGRMHTDTGRIETWRYVVHSPDVPQARDNRVLLEPNMPNR